MPAALHGVMHRYTAVTEVQVKPNPKKTSSPVLQMEAEAEKVSREQQKHTILIWLSVQLSAQPSLPVDARSKWSSMSTCISIQPHTMGL